MKFKKLFIIILLVVVAAAITGGGIYYKSTNDIRTFKKSFSSGQYAKALEQYNSLKKSLGAEKFKKFNEKVEFYFQDEFKNIEKKVKDGKMTGDQAISALNSMGEYDMLKEKIQQERTWIIGLNDSMSAYKSGLANLEKKDYNIAMGNFSNVIKYDGNYDDAQKKIKEILPLLRKQILDKAEELAKNKDFASAQLTIDNVTKYYPDDKELKDKMEAYKAEAEKKAKEEKDKLIEELKNSQQVIVTSTRIEKMAKGDLFVIVKNLSNKTVKKYKVGVLEFDSNGNPLGSDNLINCSTSGEFTISKNESTGSNYYWELDGNCDKVKACIAEVVFTDGSTWENPYFPYWVEQQKSKY